MGCNHIVRCRQFFYFNIFCPPSTAGTCVVVPDELFSRAPCLLPFLCRLVAARDRKLGHKHKHAANRDSDDDDETGGEKFAVQPQELEGYRKRRRATLEER